MRLILAGWNGVHLLHTDCGSPCLLDGQGEGLEDVVHLVVDVPEVGHQGPRVPGLGGGAVADHGAGLMRLMVMVVT